MTAQGVRPRRRPVFGLPLQIVLGLILGLLTGLPWPATGAAMQPRGTAFVSAVKMVVIPLVFCAVALGSMKMDDDLPRLRRVAPIAVFGVIAWLFATQGSATVWALAKLAAVMYLGYALFALLCIAGFSLVGERPLFVTRPMAGPELFGFITRSSEVALPLHLEKLEAIGVPSRIVSVVLPLGYSFNLDGTALIASKGAANVPSGSLIALSTVSLALGLPAEAVALMAGVDVFLDMGRAAMNAFGNTLSVLVARGFTESYIEAPADAGTVIG